MNGFIMIFTTYVVTHNQKTSSDKINFTNESSVDLGKKTTRGKWERYLDMWWCNPYPTGKI